MNDNVTSQIDDAEQACCFHAAHRDEAAMRQLLTQTPSLTCRAHLDTAGCTAALTASAARWRISRKPQPARLTGSPIKTRVAETLRVHAGRINDVRRYYADTAMAAALGHPDSGAPQP